MLLFSSPCFLICSICTTWYDRINVRTYTRYTRRKATIRIAHDGAPARDGSCRPGKPPWLESPRPSSTTSCCAVAWTRGRGSGVGTADFRVPRSISTRWTTRTTTRAVKSHRARHGRPRMQGCRPHHQPRAQPPTPLSPVPVPVQSSARARKTTRRRLAPNCQPRQSKSPSRPPRAETLTLTMAQLSQQGAPAPTHQPNRTPRPRRWLSDRGLVRVLV